MCVGKPKVPQVPDVPDRRAAILPDLGQPAARMQARNRMRSMASSMIFTNQGTLGTPPTASPSMRG